MALGWMLVGAAAAGYVILRRVRTYQVEVWRPTDPNDTKWVAGFYPAGGALVDRRHVIGSRDKADSFVVQLQHRLSTVTAPRMRMVLLDYDGRVLGSWMREKSAWAVGGFR